MLSHGFRKIRTFFFGSYVWEYYRADSLQNRCAASLWGVLNNVVWNFRFSASSSRNRTRKFTPRPPHRVSLPYQTAMQSPREPPNLADFRDFPGLQGAFAAPTGGPGGVARCHLHGLGTRYDKKIKTKKNWSKLFFSMRKNFPKKNRNRKKSRIF